LKNAFEIVPRDHMGSTITLSTKANAEEKSNWMAALITLQTRRWAAVLILTVLVLFRFASLALLSSIFFSKNIENVSNITFLHENFSVAMCCRGPEQTGCIR
jgi:hypothetical protein